MNGQTIAVATDLSTYLLSMSNDSLQILQQFNRTTSHVKFSRDGEHLVTNDNGEISIFQNQLLSNCRLPFCLDCANQTCRACN